MLSFHSASTRIVNSKRAITECLDIALGEQSRECNLIIIHAAMGHNFNDLLEQTRKEVPTATIVGSSCCGVVGREGVSESMKDIGIMAVKGNEFMLAYTDGIYGNNAKEKCREMALKLKHAPQPVNMVYFLASGIDMANDDCIAGFEEILGKDVTIFGATSSDNMKGYISYQCVNNQVYEHGAYAIGFYDPTLKVDTQATHGFVAVGEALEVTRSVGHIIKEFNGKPAWSEYLRLLGLPENAQCGDSIPIGALGEKLSEEEAREYGNSHILRVVTRHAGEDMYYATKIAAGTKLWLTKRDENLIFSEMERMVQAIIQRNPGAQPVAVFHADCLARGRFLFNKIMKEELVERMQFPFFKNGTCPPWLGMYGFGEFARLGGKNTYHNYTTGLYVLYRQC